MALDFNPTLGLLSILSRLVTEGRLISTPDAEAGAVAGRGRWRCDAVTPAGGPSRISPGRLDARRGPLTAGRPTRPGQWTQAECQGLKRWRVTGPAMGLNVTNGRPPGTMRSKPQTSRAERRGTGNFVVTYSCESNSKITRGCGAVVAPAFRAPSALRGRIRKARSSDGLPGAAKEYGR